MPKVAIYARVSTKDKQDLDNQLIPLQAYCERMGWGDVSTYTDKLSGKTTDRPNYKALSAKLAKHEYDVLLVSKIDRLSRSMVDFCNFALQLDTWGIRLLVLDQGIDTDKANPASRLLVNLLAAFAQFERELIVERIKRGMDTARAKGKYIGGKRNEKLDEYWDLVKLWKEKYPKLGYRRLAGKLLQERGIKVSYWSIKARFDEEKQQCNT